MWLSGLRNLFVGRTAGPEAASASAWSDDDFLRVAYEFVLGRAIDEPAREALARELATGATSRNEVLTSLRTSAEMMSVVNEAQGSNALHFSRGFYVRSLPPARRIIDLGGVALGDHRGALVTLGYPYPFDEIVIVDLPSNERHPTYRSEMADESQHLPQGVVRYEYHSMADLSRYADDSFDMAMSGQSFEHITREEGASVLDQLRRIVRPGGHIALDTPNRAATAVHLRRTGAEFIDEDHKVEYYHHELVELFESAELVVERAAGLNLVRPWIDDGTLTDDEIGHRPGMFADIEGCYLLTYLLRVP